jgi:hypothetical protein
MFQHRKRNKEEEGKNRRHAHTKRDVTYILEACAEDENECT